MSPCEFLPWDSEFFGLRIARLRGDPSADRLRAALGWCAHHSADCLYMLAATDDDAAVESAEGHGFHLVDVRVTLVKNLDDNTFQPARAESVRPFRPSDLTRLKALARTSHVHTRFFHDPHFPRERCHALYETWLEKSTTGYADRVLVADAGDQPAGYATCHFTPEGTGSVGLLAVDPVQRGHGLAQQLVDASIGLCHGAGMRRVSVVTQGRNIAGQRLYQRSGFLTETTQLWYHLWPRIK